MVSGVMAHTKFFEIPGYHVLEALGRGAGSTIWMARQESTGKLFAVKRVIRNSPDDVRFLKQAENEYEIGSQLRHPVIRHLEDLRRVRRWGRTREIRVVMEFCPGKSMQDKCPSSVADILRIYAKVGEGLGAMHVSGFLHTDIKPNNIIVDTDGTVKVIDLGQSCRVGTIKPRIQGTPDFIAPEQVNRAPLDARTDVFNFGASLYWSLTGQPIKTTLPKSADDLVTAGKQQLRPANKLNPDVPPALASMVADCVEFQPSKRLASMKQAVAKLQLIRKQIARAKGGVSSPRAGAC